MKNRFICLVITLSFCLLSLSAEAQDPPEAEQSYSADVASYDQLLTVLYQVISGDKGVKRDWDRFKNLFAAGAQLIPARPNASGKLALQVMTPEDYVAQAGAYLESNGFFEQEIARKVDQFGPIMQVFSTYESRHKADDPEPYSRGINSIQLLDDGERWWVVNIYWTAETEELAIPKVYLPE